MLSGCGTNSKVDPKKTSPAHERIITSKLPIVIVDNSMKDIILTANNQVKNINIKVFKDGAPYTEGKVKVILPSKVLDGVDVGYFSSYEVEVGSDGIARFTYTGPQNLQGLIDSGDNGSIFTFYHEDNPVQSNKITTHYQPDSSYTPVNYILTTSSSDENYTMGLNEVKNFTLSLKDDLGNYIDSSLVQNITITSTNNVIGKLVNSKTQEEVDSLEFNGNDATSEKSFTVKTNTVSGLLPIKLEITFDDQGGESHYLSTMMNLTVFSGPPTALSISYVGVRHDENRGKFIEKFAISATDAYNNPINTRPYISAGAIVEYAVDGSSASAERNTTNPRLWHGANDSKGKLEQIGGNKAQFVAEDNAFKYIDPENDRLVLFGAGFVYEALGKWDLDSISDNTLVLKDSYYGIDRDGLYYAVGHNSRQDMCSNDGREYIGTMTSPTYQLDANGNVLVEFAYDYHLTGKDIMVWVNFTGYQADTNSTTRIGEAQKHTLRGMGLITNDKYTVAAGSDSVHLTFGIHHKDIPEWYQNAHFGFSVVGKCSVDGIVDWSNLHDARECSNNIAYVTLSVSNPSSKDCTITLDSIAVSPEFTGTNSF
jgi:hypothetical protein